MVKKCLRPTLYKNRGQTDQCRNPASKSCANCATKMCNAHLRSRCPNGPATMYGTTQHLTARHRAELQAANRLALQDVRIAKQPRTEQCPVLIVIICRYRNSQNEVKELRTYPGGVQPMDDGEAWAPDGNLSKWLARMNPEQPGPWEDKAEIIATVREAVAKG